MISEMKKTDDDDCEELMKEFRRKERRIVNEEKANWMDGSAVSVWLSKEGPHMLHEVQHGLEKVMINRWKSGAV